MSFWKGLFAAPEVVGKTVDAVIHTGDKLIFTEEEKADANMKILEWTLRFHEASKGSNIARRLIGIMFTFIFLIMVIQVSIAIWLGMSETMDALLQLSVDMLVTPMTAIIVFYFGSGIVRDYRDKK